MRESAADLDELQALLDRSYAAAGDHLRSIFRPDRLLRAADVAEVLDGIFEMHLATVTRDGAPLVAPLDGIFFKGRIWFGLPAESVRAGHVRRDPRVSTSYTRAPAIAVVVHGTAREFGDADPDFAEFDELFRALYVAVYGSGWTAWYDEQRDRDGPGFNGRIDARRMFAKH